MPEEITVNAAWAGLPDGTEVEPGWVLGVNAFAALQPGIDAVAAGGTVWVEPGVYAEAVVVTAPQKNGVTIQGRPGAIIDGTVFGANEQGLAINAAQVTVAGFTIRNVPQSYAVAVTETADVTIRDNVIEDNGLGGAGFRGGFYAREVSGLRLIDNKVLNNHNDGVILDWGVHQAEVRDNVIEGNRNTGLFIGGSGGPAPAATVLVTGNTIAQNGQGTATPLDPVDQFNIPGHAGVVVWDAGVNFEQNLVTGNNPDGLVWLHFDPEQWDAGEGQPPPAYNRVENNRFEDHPRLGILAFTLVTTFIAPVGPVVPPAAPLINGNRLTGNGEYALAAVGGSNPVAHENDISGNGAGVLSTWAGATIGGQTFPPVTVDARRNWWGADSGPFNAAENPGGQGDEVSALVDFVPWLEQPPAPGKTEYWLQVKLNLLLQAVAEVNLRVPGQLSWGRREPQKDNELAVARRPVKRVKAPATEAARPVCIATTQVYQSCQQTVVRNLQGTVDLTDIDWTQPYQQECAVQVVACRLLAVEPAVVVAVTYQVKLQVSQTGAAAGALIEDVAIVTSGLPVPPGTTVRCRADGLGECKITALQPVTN